MISFYEFNYNKFKCYALISAPTAREALREYKNHMLNIELNEITCYPDKISSNMAREKIIKYQYTVCLEQCKCLEDISVAVCHWLDDKNNTIQVWIIDYI